MSPAKMMASALLLTLTASSAPGPCSAFTPPRRASTRRSTVSSPAAAVEPPPASPLSGELPEDDVEFPSTAPRRAFLRYAAVAAAGGLIPAGFFGGVDPALALVKGNAPPPKKDKAEKKCSNVEECQEMAERLAAQQEEENRASLAANPPKTAPGGSRYRDVDPSPDGEGAARVAKSGDAVFVRYKVLKLGKRSYDGLSGEGTVVFSRGYGLEDDENKAGDKTFDFTLGSPYVIAALNDAVPGMAVGSTRRIAVLPQMGWRKPGKECDGGPGGSGAGGELKTDYVVVPTATMVAEEACFDKSRLPFPSSYAQQRRMAQRFDQSLIVEVSLVGIN